MNKQRRGELDKVLVLLREVSEKFGEAKSILETEKDAEREFYDNMPEGLQQGDRGQQADTAASNLEEAHDALDGLDLDDLISKIEEAME